MSSRRWHEERKPALHALWLHAFTTSPILCALTRVSETCLPHPRLGTTAQSYRHTNQGPGWYAESAHKHWHETVGLLLAVLQD